MAPASSGAKAALRTAKNVGWKVLQNVDWRNDTPVLFLSRLHSVRWVILALLLLWSKLHINNLAMMLARSVRLWKLHIFFTFTEKNIVPFVMTQSGGGEGRKKQCWKKYYSKQQQQDKLNTYLQRLSQRQNAFGLSRIVSWTCMMNYICCWEAGMEDRPSDTCTYGIFYYNCPFTVFLRF